MNNITINALLKSHSLKPWHSYSPSMSYLCVQNNIEAKDCNNLNFIKNG